jgi:hypothetical protein
MDFSAGKGNVCKPSCVQIPYGAVYPGLGYGKYGSMQIETCIYIYMMLILITDTLALVIGLGLLRDDIRSVIVLL